MDDDTIMITSFISAWGWQILAMMSLFFSMLFLSLPRTMMTIVFYVALFFVFIGCEFISLKRKSEVQE